MRRATWGQLWIAMAAAVASAGSAPAQTTTCGATTWQLTAGQTIGVGTLSVSNDANYLYVTYDLSNAGASFGTLHLWVGNNLANLPENNSGVPVPGQFPFSYDATGLTSYTFAIPFSDLSIADASAGCGTALYVVAHAEVLMDGGTETAFGGDNGINVNGPGRWWYYGVYTVCCDFGPPPTDLACETAFAKGGWVFTTDKKSNPEHLPSLNLSKNRWGWAINLTTPGTTTYDIWAGAGLNRTGNGVKVGTLTVTWTGAVATVAYDLTAPNVMAELHIFAGDQRPTTVAPGQFGYTAYLDPKAASYTADFTVSDTDGDGIWIVAHAVTCR